MSKKQMGELELLYTLYTKENAADMKIKIINHVSRNLKQEEKTAVIHEQIVRMSLVAMMVIWMALFGANNLDNASFPLLALHLFVIPMFIGVVMNWVLRFLSYADTKFKFGIYRALLEQDVVLPIFNFSNETIEDFAELYKEDKERELKKLKNKV